MEMDKAAFDQIDLRIRLVVVGTSRLHVTVIREQH